MDINNTKKTTLYLPLDLHKRLTDHAKGEKRSWNAQVVHILEEYMNEIERSKQDKNQVLIRSVADNE
jgi:hypothetical protein